VQLLTTTSATTVEGRAESVLFFKFSFQMKKLEQLCNRAELAARLDVSPSTIYNWTRWGQIRSHKIGPRQVRYVWAEVLEDLGLMENLHKY